MLGAVRFGRVVLLAVVHLRGCVLAVGLVAGAGVLGLAVGRRVAAAGSRAVALAGCPGGVRGRLLPVCGCRVG